MSPKKIAVLGGGLAATTAVYQLTKEPNWKEKYDITFYQLGWRIGGKGASGVNPEMGYRIEEHGLHLWMGFYENAFTMMREIYGALDRPKGAPLATFDDAFKGQSYFIFDEHIKGKWLDWRIDFPKPLGKVGDGHVPGAAEILANMFYMMLELYQDWKKKHPSKVKNFLEEFISLIKKWLGINPNTHFHLIPEKLRNEIISLEKEIVNTVESATEKLILSAAKLMANIAIHDTFHFHSQLMKNLRKWIWDEIGELVYSNDDARRLWFIIDFGTTMTSGIIDDGVLCKVDGELKLDFTKINQYDYIEWLRRNGADEKITIPCPLIVSMYDGPFAFIKGDKNKPNVEAGTILNIFLRLGFTCKENFVWRMQAGMGDTIFSPAYELFTKTSAVKFKFFHKVRNLKLSADKTNVEEIEIGRQVTLKDGKTYEPLVDVNGLKCWPSHPNYSFILDDEAKELIANEIDLESNWANWQDREIINLKKGVDFDEIIIGASIASLPIIASELVEENPAWQTMIGNVQTVQTQAYQFWFIVGPNVLKSDGYKLLSTYVETVDTFCAMEQLICREKWPNGDAKYVSYLCGAMPESEPTPPPSYHDFPSQQKELTRERAFNYLQENFQHLVPGLFDENGQVKYDYFKTIGNEKGKERFDKQFFRCNIDPSERYVLSVANSSKYRLKTNQSGFNNVYITGDWIQNGLNAGFVEGAVTSGLLTARAISGNNKIPIIRAPWEIWED